MTPELAILLSIGGWVIGFLSSILGGYILERRRAFRAVIGACHSVESRLTDKTDFSQFHQWSIGVLEVPFFAGIGFLNSEDQNQASEAWGSYQSFDPTCYPEDNFMGGYSVVVGVSSMTRPLAMRTELEKIRVLFSRFP